MLESNGHSLSSNYCCDRRVNSLRQSGFILRERANNPCQARGKEALRAVEGWIDCASIVHRRRITPLGKDVSGARRLGVLAAVF